MQLAEITEGLSEHIRIPSSGSLGPILCHFLAPIENPVGDSKAETIIVFRYWLKRRQRWEWRAEPFYVLAIYNDWPYEHLL